MKKIALILCLCLITSLFVPLPAFGISSGFSKIPWSTWSITCDGKTSCSHNFVYIDTNNDDLIFRLNHLTETEGLEHKATTGTLDFKDNFDIEFRVKFEEFSEEWGVQIGMPGARIMLQFKEGALRYELPDTSFESALADIGYGWHTWTVEKRGDIATIYMDGGKLVSYAYRQDATHVKADGIMIYGSTMVTTSPKAIFDYFALRNLDSGMTLTPNADTVYSAGDDVVLQATPSGNPGSVDYYVNNVKVGSGTSASNYQYTLLNIQPGTYTLTAKATGNTDSIKRNFYVKDARTASISAPDEVAYGNSASVSLNLSDNTNVSSVDYFVNGNFVGNIKESPYSYSISNLRLGTAAVFAKVYYTDGTMIKTDMAYINVKTSGLASESRISVGQEYELSYTAADKGRVYVYDGQFKLGLAHTATQLSCLTATGIQRLSTTTGKFKVVVSSGIAEVYRDGQFVVSFCMPLDSTSGKIQYTNITDISLGGSGVKATMYSRTLGSETEVLDENINIGLYYSLEFDKKDTSAETIHLYDGEYEILLKLDGGIKALTQESTSGTIEEWNIADSVDAGYYRLTVYRGLAQLFVNNNFVASFRAPLNPHRQMLERTMSTGNKSTFVTIKETDDVYYFEDDFEGGNELDWSEYWYCASDIPSSTTDAVVTGTVESGALKLRGTGTYVLDATAENPTLKWTMTLPAKSSTLTTVSGKFAVTLRYRDEYDNVKLVYEYTDGIFSKSGKWSVVETLGGTTKTVATTSNFLATATAQDFVLSVEDDKVNLSYGNTVIFDSVALTYKGEGKLGFALINQSLLTIDNVSYQGNGKVNTGVNYGAWTRDEMGGTIEVWQGTDGNAVIRGGSNLYTTPDAGETWSTPTTHSHSNAALTLQSGKFLTVGYGGDHDTARLYSSPEADAANYLSQVEVQKTGRKLPSHDVLHGRLIQTTSGRVFYCASIGSELYGDIRVYYSDNEGRSWTETTTVITTDTLDGLIVAEPQIVELPNGNIRLYLRTGGGYIYYTDSSDKGNTFSLNVKPSQLMSPTTCFAITRDYTADTPTYYAIFDYDVTTARLGAHQSPRNRFALVTSSDCQIWDYILEMDDRGPVAGIYHANPNIRAFNGVVYASGCYLYGFRYTADRNIRCLTYVMDTTKIRTRKRFANAHYIEPDYQTVHDFTDGETVLPKSTGMALVSGQVLPAIVSGDSMYDLNVAAKAFGVTALSDDSGVTLQLGDGTVTFAKGSTQYVLNGNTVNAGEVCLSEDGKYLNIKVCANIFGKNLISTDTSYLLLNPTLMSKNQAELETLVPSVGDAVEVCIRDFKAISAATDIKNFFDRYSQLLCVTQEFSDESYNNMYTTYGVLNVAAIDNYAKLTEAVDSLVYPEKAKIAQFLDELNQASAAGDADAIETMLTETYADLLPFVIDTSSLSNPGAIYQKMVGITYYSLEEVENVYYAVFEAQKYAEEGRDNSVVLSSVSKYFNGWNVIRSNNFGGVAIADGDENVATLSAYDGLKSAGKGSVETNLSGYVYQAPGSFGSNIESAAVTVNSANGTVSFNNQDGNFTIKDASGSRAKSNTIITVFDITKPEGRITGTFSDGYQNIKIDFTSRGTSVGRLPESLQNEEKLTYRIEKSFGTAYVMVKPATAADTEYVVLGSATTSSATQAYWFVKFDGDAATTVISKIGVYAATPNVKYDTSGYTLKNHYYYAANGEGGHTMQDLYNLGSPYVIGNGISVDESGNLKLAPVLNQGNAAINFGGYLNSSMSEPLEWFDRAEINMTVSVTTGGHIHMYHADNSGNRYENYYWGLGEMNNVSSQYEKSWTTGKFYSLKFVTQVAEYDETGRPRTNASLYVKDAETGKWICLARNQILDLKQDVSNPQITFTVIPNESGQEMIISNLEIKTYAKTAGDYSYINNVVDMPTIDYNFSFDYMRINDDIATEFVIGGTDYQRTFSIGADKVSSSGVNAVSTSATINEDTWYRFYGTVKMVAENKAIGTKNSITLYMADTAGNITTLAENLPMLKSGGSNGVKFRIADTATAGIKLKNIRVYNGKAIDVISTSASGGTATVIADFLNDSTQMSEDATLLTGVYNNQILSGAGLYTLTDDLSPYGTKRVTITDVGYSAEVTEPKIKIFTWKDLINLVPLTSTVTAD